MWKIIHEQTGLYRVSNGSIFDKSKVNLFFKTKKQAEEFMAKKTRKKRKLSGNALKQKAYSLIRKGAMKLVRAKGRGRKVNTRYAGKERVGVYIYKLKSRKK